MSNIPNWRSSDEFTASDKAILEYIEQSISDNTTSDDVYDNLTKYFDKRQILDLNFTVSICSLINRFHATFQTDVDQETASEDVVLKVQPAYNKSIPKD
jgi:alkylhydroperoxidase family enzyme